MREIICWGHPDLRSPLIANAYFKQLYDSLLQANVKHRFGVYDLWFSNFDLVHIQFPQHIGLDKNLVKAVLKAVLLLGGLCLARWRGKPVVWTMHNARPHGTPPWQRWTSWSWRRFEGMASGTVYLTEGAIPIARQLYPGLAAKPYAVIPHGHYCTTISSAEDKLAARIQLKYERGDQILAFVGSIRPYKGCEDLVVAFNEIENSECRNLIICGNCTPSQQRALETLRHSNRRIYLDFATTTEAAFGRILAACDVVVLPYRAILNSGSVLHALSAGRPVCAPRLGALPEIQEIVGSEWLFLYEPPLTSAVLQDALQWAIQTTRTAVDLSHFDWEKIGRMHRSFYELMLQQAGSPAAS